MKGEFELIDYIRSRFPVAQGVLGIGDDCAVLPQESGRETLVSTDMLIEGVHFLKEDINPYDLGWKSAAVNISDIAAMGGKPEASFLSFALPKSLPDEFVKCFMDGYKDLSDRYSCPLLGGDTTSSIDRLAISVTVLGSCPCGKSVKRSAALPGDLICVTGPLGDSAAGLKCILEGVDRDEFVSTLIERHYRPLPRVAEGLALAGTDGIGAMMDISDGIGSDLRHIVRASAVGAIVRTVDIPLSGELQAICARGGWDALGFAADGGEDYELLFTCRAGAQIPVPHYVIGEIKAEPGIVWEGSGQEFTGFRHF